MSEREIPAGYYRGRAVAGGEQYGYTADGKEQIALDVAVPSLGRSLTVFLFFSEAAAPYAIEKLRACGFEGDDLGSLVGIDKNEVDVVVKYEMYKGEERMKVDIHAGGGRVKLQNQMDEKAKRAFAASMKGLLRGGATPKPATPAARPSASRTGRPTCQAPMSGAPVDPGYDDGGGTEEIPFAVDHDVTPKYLRRRRLAEKF